MRNPRLRTRARVGGATLIAMVMLVACGGGAENTDGADDENTKAQAPQTPAERVAELPAPSPVSFDPEPTFTLGDPVVGLSLPAVLHERAAFVVDETGLTMFDLADGSKAVRAEPEHPVLYVNEGQLPSNDPVQRIMAIDSWRFVSRPEIAEIAGATAVVTAFPVQLADGPGVEIIAIDAVSGETVRHIALDPAGWAASPPDTYGSATVIGAHEDLLVFTTSVGSHFETHAYSLDEQEVVWTDTEHSARSMSGALLMTIGQTVDDVAPYTIREVTDNTERWSAMIDSSLLPSRSGPWVSYGDKDSFTLLDVETGDIAMTEQDGLLTNAVCDNDEKTAITVCYDGDDAFALDDASGDLLWETSADWLRYGALPWNGLLLVERGEENGTVLIDVRTGEEVGDDPGLLPHAVNEHGALIYEDNAVTFHQSQ